MRNSLTKDLLIGVTSGIAASAVVGVTDRALDRFVSAEQKAREKLVRSGSGHEVAAGKFARRVAGAHPSERGERLGRLAFAMLFGTGWGLVYSALRRKVPALSRFGGLPFAVPFFLACDGTIAPLVGFSPTVTKIPWQLNAKELANHVAWTATAEGVQRLAKAYA